MRKLRSYPRRLDCVPCANPVDRYPATNTNIYKHIWVTFIEREGVGEGSRGVSFGLALVYSIKSYELILDWTLNGH